MTFRLLGSIRALAVVLFLVLPGLRAEGQGPTRSADLERQIPPGSAVLGDLLALQRMGLLEQVPRSALLGGRIFTAREVLTLLSRLAQILRREDKLRTPAAIARLGQLAQHFEPEARALRIDLTVPPPAKPKQAPAKPEKGKPTDQPARRWLGLDWKGSAVSRLILEEGRNNDRFSTLLDLELSGDFFRVGLSGTVENSIPSGFVAQTGDLTPGRRHVFDLRDRFVELFHGFRKPAVELSARAGTERNIQFADGLVLGAFDLDGFRIKADSADGGRAFAFVGKGTDGSRARGLHLAAIPWRNLKRGKTVLVESLELGLSYVDVDPLDDRGVGVVGYHLKLDTPWLEFRLENAYLTERQGHGLFVGARTRFSPDLEFEVGQRYYKNFFVEFNNAPIYSGISGGTDENELGYYLRGFARPASFLELELVSDFSRVRDPAGRLEDHLIRLAILPRPGTAFELGLEYERDRATPNQTTIYSARAEQLFYELVRASVQFTWEEDRERQIYTIRPMLRIPLIADQLSLSITDTHRRSAASGVENLLEVRLSARFTKRFSATINYAIDLDKEGTDRLEITALFRW